MKLFFALIAILFATGFVSCFAQTPVYALIPEHLVYETVAGRNIVQERNIQRVLDKYVLVARDESTDLYYYNGNDTAWINISLAYKEVTLDTVNLDRKGRPELILKCRSCNYGSGGGDCTGAFMILNIDTLPVAVLNIKNFCSEEVFGREYNNGESSYYERNRAVSIKNKVIMIGVLKEEKHTQPEEDDSCNLSYVPAGNYIFSNGHVVKQNVSANK